MHSLLSLTRIPNLTCLDIMSDTKGILKKQKFEYLTTFVVPEFYLKNNNILSVTWYHKLSEKYCTQGIRLATL